MEKAKPLERLLANPLTQGAIATAIAAAPPSTIFAALIPVLSDFLVTKRFDERITQAIEQLRSDVNKLKLSVTDLSEPQYKLISSSLSTMLSTGDEKKLTLLRAVIFNGFKDTSLTQRQADILARAIRDISFDEAALLLSLNSESEIQIGGEPPKSESEIIFIDESDQEEEEKARGLLSLGLLKRGSNSWGNYERYRLSIVALKLANLIRVT